VRSKALEHRRRGVVLTGNKVQRARVPLAVPLEQAPDFWVARLNRHECATVYFVEFAPMNKRKKVAWRKHRVKAKKSEEKQRTGAVVRRG
jgi:hypothetical protein